MAKEMKRDIVIAVVDSGLDTSHEDIKSNILINKAECDGDKIPFNPKQDKDGNGYVGDCMGWNFTAGKDGNNNVDDSLGHGTHVAGIIAAEVGNGIGVAGVSNRLKVLPIKVTDEKDSGRSMTDRAAKAILYAIKMKADVINFSMGWPVSADSQFLRKSFEEARNVGVVIVAAAGNNTSAAPVFPCSYAGVICVGAVTLSGEVANFSNYGGHVDMMAPGDQILSLYPKGKDPKIFSVKGYDLMDGTSQAAPYVASQAAILKGLLPNISVDEIQARLASSAKPLKWGEKYALRGLTDVTQALAVKPQPVVQPLFKNVYQIPFTMKDKKFKFALQAKNYWSPASKVSVDLQIGNENLKLDYNSFDFESMATGEIKEVEVGGTILDTTGLREARLQVKVSVDNLPAQVYQQQLVLTRTLENDEDVKTYPLQLTSNPQALTLLTVNSLRDTDAYPDYYQIAEDTNGRGLTMKFVRYKSGAFVEEAPITLPEAKSVNFAFRVDLNYDGKSDYVISSEGGEAPNEFIQLTYLNHDLKPIFGRQETIRIKSSGKTILGEDNEQHAAPDGGGINLQAIKSLSIVPATTPYGKIGMLTFQTVGLLPNADLNPDEFAFEPNRNKTRIYFYQPVQVGGKWTLVTRSYDNGAWDKLIRQRMQLPFRQNIALSSVLTQSPKDFASGVLRILVRWGEGSLVQYKTAALTSIEQMINREFTLAPTSFQGQTFENSEVGAVANLDGIVPVQNAQAGLSSFYSGTLARFSALNAGDSTRVESTQRSEPVRMQDALLGFVKAYMKDGKLTAIYQSKSLLIAKTTGAGTNKRDQKAIDRVSLINDYVFNSLFFPITYGAGDEKKSPAIYVDITRLTMNRIYLWTVDKGGNLLAPMHMNVEIPKGCKPLAPRRFGLKGEMAYVLQCQEKSASGPSWSLKTLIVK